MSIVVKTGRLMQSSGRVMAMLKTATHGYAWAFKEQRPFALLARIESLRERRSLICSCR